jgi:hypothetical protein
MLLGIFGAGRNGSTLLQRLLDGSPDLWVHPVEVNYLSVLSDLIQYGRVEQRTLANASVKPLFLEGELERDVLLDTLAVQFQEIEWTYLPNLVEPLTPHGDPRELLDRPRYGPAEFLPALLEAVRRCYDSGGERRYLVFKSIETPYIADYERVFPELRFLHILRNPLDNYSSLKRTNVLRKGWSVWHHGGDELRMFLEARWVPHARFLTRTMPERHLIVRYEDLVRDPEGVVGEICAWLGAAPPADGTTQTVLGGRRMREFPLSPSKDGVKTPEKVVADMAGRHGYEDVLSARERDFITIRTSSLCAALGYGENGASPARLGLALRWTLPDRWELRNARSKRRLATALVRRRWYIWRSLLGARSR